MSLARTSHLPDIPLSLYVHFPWCVKKCPYCDFNSHAVRDDLPERDYVDALIQDFAQQLKGLDGRLIETVFMGGGTPSLISPAQIKRLMDFLFASGRLQQGAEVTLEANPGTLDEHHFNAYLKAGINRLSIGVQSFSDESLLRIGRIHSAGDASRAIKRAKQAGFKRINLDLMYALPGQSAQDAKADIEQALAFDVSHLSVYQLTIEANTQFAVRPPALPDTDKAWAMHEQAYSLLRGAGFDQYEVSAYSRDSNVCRHNLNYWQFGDYLAIGAGAHGKISSLDDQGALHINRYWNHRHPKRYLQASVEHTFSAEPSSIAIEERDFEYLMNALRLSAGFSLRQYESRTGGKEPDLLRRLAPFIRKNWLVRNEGAQRVYPSEEGYRFIDSILLDCLPLRR